MRKLVPDGLRQAGRVDRQRQRAVRARNAVFVNTETAVRSVVQGELLAFAIPGDDAFGHPVSLLLAQVADRAARTEADRENLGVRIEREEHLGDRVVDRERNVRAVLHATVPVVFVPAFVDSDFRLVVALRQEGREAVNAVTVRILQPGPEAIGLPVARAADFALEAARHGRDDRVDVVGHPVSAVFVVELDVLGSAETERDIRTVQRCILAVVFVPGVVEGRLVLPVAGRHVERALPHAVIGVEAELRCRAVGLPVARTAQFFLQAAGNRDGGRLGKRRRNVDRQHLRSVVERELHFGDAAWDREGDVRTTGHAVLAVVLGPAFIDRDFRLVVPTG